MNAKLIIFGLFENKIGTKIFQRYSKLIAIYPIYLLFFFKPDSFDHHILIKQPCTYHKQSVREPRL